MSEPIIIDEKAIKKLAKILKETDLNEIEYVHDNTRIKVARQGVSSLTSYPSLPFTNVSLPVTPNDTILAAPVVEKALKHPGAVESPMVGTAYLSAEPGATPFVVVGQTVNQGDTLVIVESMKVMNPIRSPRSGKVSQVLVSNAAPVEFGEVLMIIE